MAEMMDANKGLSFDDALRCKSDHVYCVDEYGKPLAGEAAPNLREGDTLQVSVFHRDASINLPTCTLELDPPSSAASRTYRTPAVDRFDFPQIPSVPAGSVTLRVKVTCSGAAAPSIDAPITLPVGKAGYYFEPTLLFPIVFNGSQTVTAAAFASGRDAVISQQQQTAGPLGAIENVSLGVDVFPFGGYPGGSCSTIFTSCSKGRGEGFLHMLTLQAAVAIATNPLRNFYLGGGLTVIPGVSVTTGVAFVQGEFLTSAVFPGEIISSTQAQPANLQKDYTNRYMFEPYLGISLTPDIFTSIVSGLSQLKSVAPAHISPSTVP